MGAPSWRQCRAARGEPKLGCGFQVTSGRQKHARARAHAKTHTRAPAVAHSDNDDSDNTNNDNYHSNYNTQTPLGSLFRVTDSARARAREPTTLH